MKKKTCYLFVFNGYADWEPSLAIAGLQKYTDVEVKTFSVDGKAVRSMGNLRVQPDFALHQLDETKIDLLLLPGGDAWESGGNTEIIPLVTKRMRAGRKIAAICAATAFLGNAGFLDHLEHTSNHLKYLENFAPAYRGEDWYINKPAVSGKHLITAAGTAPVEFALEIFKQLAPENNALKIFSGYFIPAE